MSKKRTIKRIVWGIFFLLLAAVLTMTFFIYRNIYSPNIATLGKNQQYIFIPTGSDFEDVVSIIRSKELLKNEKSFRWLASEMKYTNRVKPGKYRLKSKMSNKELISLLRSGRQEPVKIVFNNIRTKDQLAEKISSQIEASKESILNLLNDKDYTKSIGFTPDNVLALFLPNTYELYWNTSADKFIKRMKSEYQKFWTADRMLKAKKLDLSPVQVSIVASIVQLESNRADEKPIIAGVYLNRYKKDWKLEADPTLVYALGDFTVNRVLNVYKEIDSPYNTYMYKGLPPGPICLPTISSIDAVLNRVEHNYMYFCAKDDFSGYHSFAETFNQHLLNAQRFRKALDRRGIKS